MAVGKVTSQHLLSLREERDRIASRIVDGENILSHLKGELAGIDRAIAMMRGLPLAAPLPSVEERRTRGALKDAVLGLLTDHKEGLRASDLIDLARAKGVNLDRGSVASLLSRLARDNVILFDTETRRYGVKNAIQLDLVKSDRVA